ncbi:adenyl-nucleotide exchange factor sse1 [Serendipita sp. 400]|nr:adenyl-nucleotide exchange factor sse1 [Serendipita sp. 400]
MAVVGIDLGCLNTKIGVARRKGIDIIANETSNRTTPSLVSFGVKQRAIGEPAKTQEISNFKNTIGSLKRLIGRSASDPDITEQEKKFITAALVDVTGSVGVKVNYAGETQEFSATQLVGMFLGKIRDTAANELKIPVSDVVIAVPSWYTDVQRRAIMDAAQIAALNPLRIINETTAVALGYGITKSDLPDPENPRHVMFIDAGHSSFTVTIVAFSKNQLAVKSSASDRFLGGRDIDYALVQHFSAEFKTKYKIDVLGNPKATFRLIAGCEKLKKVLSANAEANLSVESIMNDVDASSRLSREALEGLIAPVLERVTAPIQKALEDAQLTPAQIDSIELVGGTSRVPAIKQRIQALFPGKVLSTTLNQDEAVARGATFACAMLSPVFKVREFTYHDVAAYPVKVQWEPTEEEPESELIVFPKGNTVPSTKILTTARTAPFDIEAAYAEPDGLPGGINPWIARATVKGSPAAGDSPTYKVKTRMNANGIVSFEGAYYEEIEEKEDPMEVDAKEGEAAPKKKKIVKKKDVPVVTGYGSLDTSVLHRFREQEASMHAADKLVKDTEDRKNALEEYIYDMRGKLDDRYAAYVQAEEKEKLMGLMTKAEDWLYSDEGEDATKSAYTGQLDTLKTIGDPIAFRYTEHSELPRAASLLRDAINQYYTQATSGEEKYSHIPENDIQSVVEKVATTQKWLDDALAKQAEKPKSIAPVITTSEIKKKREDLVYYVTPIMSRPKPKPATTETPPPPSSDAPPQPEGGDAEAKKPTEPSNMDVD